LITSISLVIQWSANMGIGDLITRIRDIKVNMGNLGALKVKTSREAMLRAIRVEIIWVCLMEIGMEILCGILGIANQCSTRILRLI
jgi:hypothetical protein